MTNKEIEEKVNELGVKYHNTGKEVYFEKFIELITPLIHYRINQYKLYSRRETAYQRVCLGIWKNFHKYTPEKGTPKRFVMGIVINTLKKYLDYLERKKRKIYQNAVSLNKKVYKEDSETELHELILKGGEFEDNVISGFNTYRLYKIFSTQLSKMEKDILDACLKDYEPHSRRNWELIIKETGYRQKQIDNALERLKTKARNFFEEDLLKRAK